MVKPDSFGCVGNSIKLLNGKYLDLLNPDPVVIDLPTIATVLGRICRFGGHSPRFYSVAEHCVQMTRLATKQGIKNPALRSILLHDAAEAYIGDVTKPLKNLLTEYHAIETNVEEAIAEHFGCDFAEHRAVIKTYDRAMLSIEKQQLWPDDAERWEGFSNVDSDGIKLQYWSPEQAARMFVIKAQHLRIYGSAL